MAEVQTSSAKPPGKVRSRKMSTRIDFTPMVDLGFLLITFFMLATTLNKPQVMALVMPDTEAVDPPVITDRRVLTLLLGDRNKVYWYEGITDARLDSTDYSARGLRRVILDKMAGVQEELGVETYRDRKTGEARQGSHLNVLIKPTAGCRYENLVDALDEMAVCHVRYYMILDISPQEEAFVKNPAGGLAFSAAQQEQAMRR